MCTATELPRTRFLSFVRAAGTLSYIEKSNHHAKPDRMTSAHTIIEFNSCHNRGRKHWRYFRFTDGSTLPEISKELLVLHIDAYIFE
jgi:hypothetical protein